MSVTYEAPRNVVIKKSNVARQLVEILNLNSCRSVMKTISKTVSNTSAW